MRVYVEGGAEGKTADSAFRKGWKRFLAELHELAMKCGYQGLEIVRGKGRGNAFRLFCRHQNSNPDDLCVLLADAESTVPEGTSVWNIVARREGDGWHRPRWATDAHLYLMVHFVETWLLTDQDALHAYFRRGFNPKPLPTTALETRTKQDIEHALEAATSASKRGPYRHGQAHEIIGTVRPDQVRTLEHGRRIFEVLGKLIQEGNDA